MGGPIAPFIYANDKLWRRGDTKHVVEVSSAATNADLIGVGSSPWDGDLATTGLLVPPTPTDSQNNRYLVRLCGIEIPTGNLVVLCGVRQAATIRHVAEPNGQPLVIEREIESPFWSFLDGNISWHIRWQKNRFSRARVDAAAIPGTSPNTVGMDTALLYTPPLAPYVALGRGQPPGQPLGALGTWRDMRFPWQNTDWSLNELIRGPGAIVMYASVRQPDPEERPLYPDVEGMRPEDRFLSNFPDAVYGVVAGAMSFEIQPCRPGEGKTSL